MRAILAVIALAASTGELPARDRIVLQPPDKVSPLTISGDIADYTADKIEIHLTVGKPVHTYPASQVVSVQTVHTDAHQEGVHAFNHGDLETAEERFETALKEEPRGWVQREILGWLIKIAMRRGNRTLAGRRFLQVVTAERAPREYAVIPLVWGTATVDSNLQQHGRLWLTGGGDVERLLGASLLLLDQKYSEVARTELDRLARIPNSRIAALARMQMWRLRVSAPDITDNEMAGWEQAIERLPPELRSGPYFLLGRAALQRSEYDRAAAAFMQLPAVYYENEPLAAEAGLMAVTSLRRVGRPDEGHALLTELTTEYAWSPVAIEARALLAEGDTGS